MMKRHRTEEENNKGYNTLTIQYQETRIYKHLNRGLGILFKSTKANIGE